LLTRGRRCHLVQRPLAKEEAHFREDEYHILISHQKA
jgi:hypothetical protein